MRILEANGVTKYFGGVKALDGFDFYINEGEIVGLIGPNGAGKTTFFNCVTGVYHPTHGELYYKGIRITHLRPDEVAALGISRTFQAIRLFRGMTVLENVLIGTYTKTKSALIGAILRPMWVREEEKWAVNKAIQYLEFVGLKEYQSELANNLPYGSQRKLEIARALASEPSLILLDEPAAGMNPVESNELMELVKKIRDRGITVLVIEHHMRVVMGICDRIAVLNYGVKIADDSPSNISNNPKVIEAYLGSKDA